MIAGVNICALFAYLRRRYFNLFTFMQKLYPILALCLCLFACTKDRNEKSSNSTSSAKYPVSFNISGFTQTSGTFSTTKQTAAYQTSGTTTPADAGIAKLIYAVFDANGLQVSRMEQNITDNGKLYRIENNTKKLVNSANVFGVISDSLAKGTYTIMIGGSSSATANLNVAQKVAGQDYYTTASLSDAKFFPTSDNTMNDVFYYKGQLTVGTTNVAQTVTLNRIVGKLALNIEDAIPAGAAKITVAINGDNTDYRVNLNAPEGTLSGNLKTITLTDADKGKTNYNQAWTVLNTVSPVSAVVTVYDASSKVLFTKTINNIQVSNNQKTTVTGKLFSSGSMMTVNVNQDWGTNGTTVSFDPQAPSNGSVMINGASYSTVVIGKQTWTSVNYNGTGGVNYNNGTNDPISGKLYSQDEINQLVLPSGWRIPTKADFETLLTLTGQPLAIINNGYYGIETDATQKLMSSTGWQAGNGNNAIGFNAVPAGYYGLYTSLTYQAQGTQAAFWSSTPGLPATLNGANVPEATLLMISSYTNNNIKTSNAVINTQIVYSGQIKCSLRFVKDNL